MEGLFISFEGMDGCGKSTQIRLLNENLTGRGYIVTPTREPGGCTISESIRKILLDVDNSEMSDTTEALLYAAARAQHVDEVIKPELNRGRIVLADRFLDSSLAYQGIGRDLGLEHILKIGEFSTGGLKPYKTFFLDLPPDRAFLRMNENKQKDRLETQKKEFYTKVYNGFVELCEREPDRFIRIDASGEKQDTHSLILSEMNKILEQLSAEPRKRLIKRDIIF